MTYAFDTLGYAKRLRAAGLSSDQAEAHAEAARDFVMGELVTRFDLERTRRELDVSIDGSREGLEAKIDASGQRLEAQIASLKQELEAKIASVKQELEAKIASVKQELEAQITSVKQELEAAIAGVEQRLEASIAALRQELASQRRETAMALERLTLQMTVRLGGMIAIAVAVLATIIKF